jgi:hypothetical protein
MIVACAEALDPVLYIAGFARRVVRAVSIVDVLRAEVPPEPQKAFFFGDPDRRVRGVA